jgi:hypothetical protein
LPGGIDQDWYGVGVLRLYVADIADKAAVAYISAISVIRGGKRFFVEQRSLIHRGLHRFFRRLFSPSLQLEKSSAKHAK